MTLAYERCLKCGGAEDAGWLWGGHCQTCWWADQEPVAYTQRERGLETVCSGCGFPCLGSDLCPSCDDFVRTGPVNA